MSRRSIAGIVSGALMLSGALASTALAHHDNEENAKTSVSMAYKKTKSRFFGQVDSARDRCLGGRTVGLFKARNDAKVDTTHTTDSGVWSLAARRNSGKYYAKVQAETYVVDSKRNKYEQLLWEHLLTCGPAKSDVEST